MSDEGFGLFMAWMTQQSESNECLRIVGDTILEWYDVYCRKREIAVLYPVSHFVESSHKVLCLEQ